MSVDTSHARPTSTPSPDSTMSAWDAMQVVLDAERATRVAATRREFYAEPAKARTVADVEDDIRRYTKQLQSTPVVRNLRWWSDVTEKLAAAQAELTNLTAGGAR